MFITTVSQLLMQIFYYFTTFVFFIEFPMKKIYFLQIILPTKDNKLLKNVNVQSC